MGPGRAGYLCRRAAKQCGKQADARRTIKPRNSAGPGCDAECNGKGQGNDGGGQPAENVATQIACVKRI